MDPYAILGIAHDATDEQIQKAYRKKARKCHPDKNPDNPEAAAEIFKELQKALELLGDKEAKGKYDQTRKAKEAARKRREELDKETKRAREELDAREKRAKMEQLQKEEERKQQNEKKRLQAEGIRLLEETQERMRQKQKVVSQGINVNTTSRGFQLVKPQRTEMRRRLPANTNPSGVDNKHTSWSLVTPEPIAHEFILVVNSTKARTSQTVELRWSCDRSDLSNGGYTADLLRKLFSKYGEVTEVMVSSRKRGRGIVEFRTKDAAMVALEKETGLPVNPLQVKWTGLGCNPTSAPSPAAETLEDRENFILTKLKQLQEKKERTKNEDNKKDIPMQDTASIFIDRDRESVPMMRARQEEERQRLIEEMKKQDENEES